MRARVCFATPVPMDVMVVCNRARELTDMMAVLLLVKARPADGQKTIKSVYRTNFPNSPVLREGRQGSEQ